MMKKALALALVLLTFCALAAYAGAYYWVVEVTPFTAYYTGRPLTIGVPCYHVGDADTAQKAFRFFAPMQRVDRMLRPGVWGTASEWRELEAFTRRKD